MSKVTHFEISADNPGRAMDLNSKVFGWTFKQWGEQEYWLATTGDKKDIGINGAILPRTDPTARVVNTIGVHSIDETIEQIKRNGGTIVIPKLEVPKVGWLVYFMDTEGNVFGAIEPFPNSMM